MNEREAARELLRELLDGALANGNGNGNGGGDARPAVPAQVPAPPVPAVLRPSTWRGPPAPGEVVGDGTAREAADAPERVAIGSDADLERFVRTLAERLEDPRQRAAIRAGRIRFTLQRDGGPAAPTPPNTVRVDRGAVTERTVAQAARSGARLVLGPRAVLTPLAREKARAAGIEIEREQTC